MISKLGEVRSPAVAWAILVCAGLLEIVWATALRNADGFTRLWPSVIGIAFSLASFVMLAVALKSLPVGSTYAVWVGIVEVEGGLISGWREYQYRSELPFEEVAGGSLRR
jgi:multidrug transporter EmrE-like cation transporter